MISAKSTLEIIAKIEGSFDVNSVIGADLMMWPLIRLRICQQLSSPEQNYTREEHRDNGKIPVISAGKKQLEFLRRYKDTEILFFSRKEKYVEQIDGKPHNPYIDPMVDLVRGSHGFLKVELSSIRAPYASKVPFFDAGVNVALNYATCVAGFLKAKFCKERLRFEPTLFLDPEFYRGTSAKKNISNFNELKKTVEDIAGVQIDRARFIEEAELMKAWEGYFVEILTEIRPKAVFFECYYYTIPMALVGACRKLGIKTVDIQHGLYGNYHGLYTHWTKIPLAGYEMLPDFFWCWGKVSENCISKWHSPDCLHHRPIVGGNARLLKWIGGDDPIIDEKMKDFYGQLKQKGKIVLVAMCKSTPLPEHVYDAMKHSPKDWLWLIRLHPVESGARQQKQVRVAMKQRGIYNFDVENATYCQLYGLLKRVNHLVILGSSTYYEALAFNVPTTVVHQIGLEVFEDDFKKGVFDYADTGEALLASINNGFNGKHRINPSDYIETNRQTAENAIEAILGFK